MTGRQGKARQVGRMDRPTLLPTRAGAPPNTPTATVELCAYLGKRPRREDGEDGGAVVGRGERWYVEITMV